MKNKKANFNYIFIEKEIAGIVLVGTEVKSIRLNKISFTDSYCYFKNNELWLKNLHISEYKEGTYNNHEPKRDRKLLLKKQQILKLQKKVNEDGLTILMIIHDLNLAGEYCNNLVMLNRGKVHITGTPGQVLNYNDIEEVYKTVVITQKNPLSGNPAIFLVSRKSLGNNK